MISISGQKIISVIQGDPEPLVDYPAPIRGDGDAHLIGYESPQPKIVIAGNADDPDAGIDEIV